MGRRSSSLKNPKGLHREMFFLPDRSRTGQDTRLTHKGMRTNARLDQNVSGKIFVRGSTLDKLKGASRQHFIAAIEATISGIQMLPY
jgi:hypothetical protein